jgi:uroporphyrinogen decarboxylase
MIKPFQRDLINHIKNMTNAKLFFHSCGAIREVIPDLIEIGVEILNPVQTTASGMNPRELKREFGKDLVFWGAIDTQRVLPFGSPKEVKELACKRIVELGKGGGYVLAPCHNIQPGTPPQNILSLYHSGKKFQLK